MVFSRRLFPYLNIWCKWSWNFLSFFFTQNFNRPPILTPWWTQTSLEITIWELKELMGDGMMCSWRKDTGHLHHGIGRLSHRSVNSLKSFNEWGLQVDKINYVSQKNNWRRRRQTNYENKLKHCDHSNITLISDILQL